MTKKIVKRKARRKKKEWKYDFERDGVTQGLILRWLRCRRSAELYLQKLSPVLKKSSFGYGNLWHEILDAWNKECGMKPKFDGTNKQYALSVLIDVAKQTIADFRSKNIATAARPDEFNLLCEQVEALVIPYLKAREYGKQYWKLDFVKRKWLESERVFEHNFRGFIIRGKRDGIFERKGIYLRENKTSSQISDKSILTTLPLNFQNQLYIVCAEEEHNIKIDGVDYNMIRRPSYTVMKNFLKALEETPEHFFNRYECSYSRADLNLFKDELEKILFDFAEWINGRMFTYRDLGSCEGRKYTCEYIPLCTGGGRELYRIREHLFEELVD